MVVNGIQTNPLNLRMSFFRDLLDPSCGGNTFADAAGAMFQGPMVPLETWGETPEESHVNEAPPLYADFNAFPSNYNDETPPIEYAETLITPFTGNDEYFDVSFDSVWNQERKSGEPPSRMRDESYAEYVPGSDAHIGFDDPGDSSAWLERFVGEASGPIVNEPVQEFSIEGMGEQNINSEPTILDEELDEARSESVNQDNSFSETTEHDVINESAVPDDLENTSWANQFQDDEGFSTFEEQAVEESWAKDFLQNSDNEDLSWEQEYENFSKNELGLDKTSEEYPFHPDNPYRFHDFPFEEGNDLLHAGAVASAALAFEAACQKDSQHVEAWQQLGHALQESEKDPLAVIALRKAVELDPLCLPNYLSLSASLTNEGHAGAALGILRQWLRYHPEYASYTVDSITSEGDEMVSEYLEVNADEHQALSSSLEQAAVYSNTDPDLHLALGIVHNLSHEYDLAAADFQSALALRSDDAILWNQLGATLANGNRSQEALQAYDRALDIKPGNVRVHYNRGISLSNLGEYAEAVRTFLRAVHLQNEATSETSLEDKADGPMLHQYTLFRRAECTREIWNMMRLTLHQMDRSDLIELTTRNDITALANEFGVELN